MSLDNDEINKIITHEELAMLWKYSDDILAVKRKRHKYIRFIPTEPKQQYIARKWLASIQQIS